MNPLDWFLNRFENRGECKREITEEDVAANSRPLTSAIVSRTTYKAAEENAATKSGSDSTC